MITMTENARPIGESEFGANDGVSNATHQVTAWLENDRPLAERAKVIARGSEFEYGDTELHAWVSDLLYDPHGPQHLADMGADVMAAKNAWSSFTQEDFDAIDWSEVRDSLLAE